LSSFTPVVEESLALTYEDHWPGVSPKNIFVFIRKTFNTLVEILADRDSDFSDLDEESDFYEPSDPKESSKAEMSNENVEDLPDKCEREESKMVAGWWVYKAPVGKGLISKIDT